MEEADRYAYAEGQETSRDKVISEVNESYLKVREAAEILGLSQRQIYRIKARVQKEGPGGVIHKSKGKKSPRWFTERIRGKIDHLYKTKYRGFNLSHMTEFLNSEEKIKVCRESVRQILLDIGSYLLMSLDLRHTHIRKKKYPKHRQWREPSSREGQPARPGMVQFDTSDHDWLACPARKGRGPKLYLIGGVDDATSKVLGARFMLIDGVRQNMEVFKGIVRKKGLPLSVSEGSIGYVDCDSNFKTTRHQGMEYRLKGVCEASFGYPSTQFARALEDLGIRMICVCIKRYAHSPQAKGRIERKFGVFQDSPP